MLLIPLETSAPLCNVAGLPTCSFLHRKEYDGINLCDCFCYGCMELLAVPDGLDQPESDLLSKYASSSRLRAAQSMTSIALHKRWTFPSSDAQVGLPILPPAQQGLQVLPSTLKARADHELQQAAILAGQRDVKSAPVLNLNLVVHQ